MCYLHSNYQTQDGTKKPDPQQDLYQICLEVPRSPAMTSKSSMSLPVSLPVLLPPIAVILHAQFNAGLIMTAGIEEVGAVAVIPAAAGLSQGSIGSSFRAHRSCRSVSEHLLLDLGSKRSQYLVELVAEPVEFAIQPAAIQARRSDKC